MARYAIADVGRDGIDAVGERWATECLIKDRSILFDDRSLWTAEHISDFYRRFVDQALIGEGSFAEKLTAQVEGASPDLRWFVSELMIVYALPVFRLFGPKGKVSLFRAPLAAGQVLEDAPHWPEVEAALEQGYGNPGVRYNARRDLQVEALLDFAQRFKALDVQQRQSTVADSWRLLEFVNQADARLHVEMRNVLLHLLRPDDFERVFSNDQKVRIRETFGPELREAGEDVPDDVDHALAAIRKFLEAGADPSHPEVDFYEPPYVGQWRLGSTVATDDDGPKWFWVNQGQTWKEEADEGILWAPLRTKNGQRLAHWERMDEVRVGDVVLHYSGALRAVSVVTQAAVRAPRPQSLPSDAWANDGRLIRSDYQLLRQPIPLAELPAQWRVKEPGGPFTSTGGVQQGYVFEASPTLVGRLLSRFDELAALAGPHGSEAPPDAPSVSLSEVDASFSEAVIESGLKLSPGMTRRILAALVAKRFVILSGLSGSGKTQLALRLGEWFSGGPQQERTHVEAVRPDWTSPDSLFGFEDALKPASADGRPAWHVPETLAFILRASSEVDMPYLLVLDEMNLAHVERYFSDFLSGVESGGAVVPNLAQSEGAWRVKPGEPARIELPQNLFVIGTINIDETTYLFSPKVLDRAFTFEIRVRSDELAADMAKPTPVPGGPAGVLKTFAHVAQEPSWHLDHAHPDRDSLTERLRTLHRALATGGDEFGHRVLFEALRFAAAFRAFGETSSDAALDQIVLLKLLPRVNGSRRRVEPVLRLLARFCEDPDRSLDQLASGDDAAASPPRLPDAHRKVERMLAILSANQFVSFAE